jgi:homoserine O-acetyltransferase
MKLTVLLGLAAVSVMAQAVREGDFAIQDFQFNSGESLRELKLHYRTLGKPLRDAQGRVTNGVLILHGTGGSGEQFLAPQFKDKLFGPGQVLDTSKYYIILPDDIGHGHSSKPSDGLRAHFPHYGYGDMVTAEYRLVTDGLKIGQLRLLMGTSMGCMHSWLWAERYPEFSTAVMPLACLARPIAGRNRMWRKMLIDAIRNDPTWQGGEYKGQPAGLTTANDLLILAGSSPLQMQKRAPTPDAADEYVARQVEQRGKTTDANDLLYAIESSRDYDPSKDLAKITAPVLWINSADDFVNPPELAIAENDVKRVKNGRFVLLPITDATEGAK